MKVTGTRLTKFYETCDHSKNVLLHYRTVNESLKNYTLFALTHLETAEGAVITKVLLRGYFRICA
jgi:hypothetical protein